MSLVVAKIVGLNICVVSDTKLSSADYEDIRSKQHPKDGVIKTTILNKLQCVSFAGSEYYAEAAFKEMGQGGNVHEMKEILFRYHALSDYKTQFIFCFVDDAPHVICVKNGQIEESKTAWIGDIEAYAHYQEYFHGLGKKKFDKEDELNNTNDSRYKKISNDLPRPFIKNIKMTINSKVPNDDFSKMSSAMDYVILNHSLSTVGGFRIQVTFDDGFFSYSRYTTMCNDEINDVPGEAAFGFSNASKGSYYVNCAKGFDNYNYAAIHVMEANLGILYRKKNGILRPELYRLDLLDFSDFVSEYRLFILVDDRHRPQKYYYRARNLFEREEYLEAIHWLCMAIHFSSREESAHLYYVLGLSFHNYGRPLTASLCFEHAISLDSSYEQVLANQKQSVDENVNN